MPRRLSQTIICSRPETEPDFQLEMINKHSTLPFTTSGYFFNPCRCVLFTLKLSYKLAKAHRMWKKAGFKPCNVHRSGSWRIPLLVTVVWPSRRHWVGRTRELVQASRNGCWLSRLWSYSARLGTMNAVAFGAAVISTFLPSVKSPKSWTDMKITYELMHGRLSLN